MSQSTLRALPRRRWRTGPSWITAACAVIGTALLLSPAAAQAPGGGDGAVRVQGEELVPDPTAPAAPVLGRLTDFRQEMRKLIMNIAQFARSRNPGFVVMTHNGLGLLEKIDEVDKRKVFPARGYMLSLDAVIQDGLTYGFEAFGQPTSKETRAEFDRLTALAKRNRIRLLSMEYTRDRKTVDRLLRQSRKNGYLPFIAHKPLPELNSLPPYPRRPFRENGSNILSMDKARNFLYIADSTPFGLEVEFALKMHDTNYDILIVDVFHGRKPFSRRAIETMKYKKLGAKRLVLARMDIGTAANYRYYWQPGWESGSPRWITAPYPTDPDRFFVEYWRPEWHQIMYGDAQSFAFGVVAQGFDGVVLQSVEAYRFFESDGQDVAGFN